MKPQSKTNRVRVPNRSPNHERAVRRDALVLLSALYGNSSIVLKQQKDLDRLIEVALYSARKLRES